jgi:hypothetical protein
MSTYLKTEGVCINHVAGTNYILDLFHHSHEEPEIWDKA